jgi:hypothetical protein
MSRFNKNKMDTSLTVNRAGGSAYTRSAEHRLVSLLLTNFLTDQFYRSANQSMQELETLLKQVDPLFAAKAAVYARNEFGMRSISHAVAAGLASRVAGTDWGRRFYDRIVRRPDDMLEITAAFLAREDSGKNLTNAMKKGFAASFDRFDGYQLAKYRGEGKQVKLIDLVNLVRPVPTKRNAQALQELVNGTLKNRDTWESKLSAAGQTAGEDKSTAKAQAWADLLKEGKLGYFALIRNLRNLLEQAPELIDLIEQQLTDENRIRRSLVLPFRLLTAWKEIEKVALNDGRQVSVGERLRTMVGVSKSSTPSGARRRVLAALEQAIVISFSNLPELKNTLVAIDNSGSMDSAAAGSNNVRCNELGALFGFALAQRSNADLLEFGTTARYLKYRLGTSPLAFAAAFGSNNKVGHGTNFETIFATAGKRPYERVIILSDMQSWLHQERGKEVLAGYRRRSGSDPFVYTIDLRGYGSGQFPTGGKVFEVAGFSEKVFDLIALAEQDPNVLLKTIEAIEL